MSALAIGLFFPSHPALLLTSAQNCFKRIFQREGKYTSFADKAGERARSSTTIDAPAGTAPAPAPVSNSASSNAVAPPAASPTERRGSVVLPCVVADCKQPRVSRKSYCLEHLNNNSSTPSGVSRGSGAAAEAMPSNVSDLFDAIASKNVDRVKDLLSGEQSAGLLFRTNARGMTPIEAAFTGIANSRACGEAMLAWLQNKVSALEQQQAAGAQ